MRECACDKNELDELRKEIESLKVLIASGKLKGDKGDQGPKGDKGEPGAAAPASKSCECKDQAGPSAAPAPVYFDIKPRKRK